MFLELVRTVSWLLGSCRKLFLGREEDFCGVTLQKEYSLGKGKGQERGTGSQASSLGQ